MPADALTVTIELEREEAYELVDLLAKTAYDSIDWPLGRALRKLRAAL